MVYNNKNVFIVYVTYSIMVFSMVVESSLLWDSSHLLTMVVKRNGTRATLALKASAFTDQTKSHGYS